MTGDSNNISAIQAALSVLISLSPKDLKDESDINTATACLMRIQLKHSGGSTALAMPATKQADDQDRHENQSIGSVAPFAYANLPISEAAVQVLKDQGVEEAMSLVDIIGRAQAGGYKFDGANPNASAHAAFDRRAKNKGDLIQVSRTHWGLRDWYTQRQIAQFRHSEITKAGLKAAKSQGRATGGRGWAISAREAADIKERLANGEKQAKIAREYGLTVNTIHRYKKALEGWEFGDPFPPERKPEVSSQEPTRALRAVE